MQLPLFTPSAPLATDFYYLAHFRCLTEWLRAHYRDLLSGSERTFIEQFSSIPRASQALLARLTMRKGPLFRVSRVHYAEIGDLDLVLAPLVARRWIDLQPCLSIEELVPLLRHSELERAFPTLSHRLSKAQALELLRRLHPPAEMQRFAHWCAGIDDSVLRISVAPLCTRLRLLYFGNFHQDWTQFVLTDLGIFQYEKVLLSSRSRAFASRRDIEDFFALHDCQTALREQVPPSQVLARLPRRRLRPQWLETHRSELLFQLARRYESIGEHASALQLYRRSHHPQARLRRIRSLEALGRVAAARAAARSALDSPRGAVEARCLSRTLRRLDRSAALPPDALPLSRGAPVADLPRRDIAIPELTHGQCVERIVSARIATASAPVYYVENALINSLFGLLCWDAIFTPVRGAFFHAFQSGPMDLYTRDFVTRRQRQFDRCLGWLESGTYQAIIRQNRRLKLALQSPFVAWGLLTEELLDLALGCIPPLHLRRYFERLLADLREHRAGLPDLVQFYPREQRYRLIEVKAPGDRLQDNQQAWVDYCLRHELPVQLCRVHWAPPAQTAPLGVPH